MGAFEDSEEELDLLYPKGTPAREVLDYSRSEHIEEEVPPLLIGAFRLLMGISAIMVIVSIVAFVGR